MGKFKLGVVGVVLIELELGVVLLELRGKKLGVGLWLLGLELGMVHAVAENCLL